MFKTIKRLVYQVSNLNQARQWYSEILSMEPVYDSPYGVIYKIDDCSLSLAPLGHGSEADKGRISAYWEVADVDAAFAKLIDAGATPHSEPRNRFSIRLAQVTDPFGNIIGLSGKAVDAAKRTVDNHPSETALNVTMCRALATTDERSEIRGPDYLAELFLTEEMQKPLHDRTRRTWVINRLITPPLYAYLMARTAYFDRCYEKALCEGFLQFVFLGAGYDTRPCRFGERAGEARIFELDAKPTQQRKREILAKAKVAIPAGLSYVGIDFATDSIDKALAGAGYDESRRTFFLWEGVMYYLTAQAVDATLSFVRHHSPSGSTLCFDYMAERLESRNAGEPFRFWIEPESMGSFLLERGLDITEHLDAKEMEKRFLTLSDGTLAEKSLTRFRLVSAIVSS
jgi:methyltransferase (TIGR00027 family)